MATWTAPTTHATADNLAVADWNALANDAIFLYQAPYAMYYNSVATSLTNGVFTQVSLGGVIDSNYGFSVATDSAIVPISGIYSVSAAVEITLASAAVLQVAIYKNATNVGQARTVLPAASTPGVLGLPISIVVPCNAGDAIALYAFQNSGGAVNTDIGAVFTFLNLAFMGSL